MQAMQQNPGYPQYDYLNPEIHKLYRQSKTIHSWKDNPYTEKKKKTCCSCN